ncbi:MAG: hypothetical protein AAF541_09345 [Pseudomonadota bacterium]
MGQKACQGLFLAAIGESPYTAQTWLRTSRIQADASTRHDVALFNRLDKRGSTMFLESPSKTLTVAVVTLGVGAGFIILGLNVLNWAVG